MKAPPINSTWERYDGLVGVVQEVRGREVTMRVKKQPRCCPNGYIRRSKTVTQVLSDFADGLFGNTYLQRVA